MTIQIEHIPWWSPDKIVKDILWEDLISASRFAKGDLLDIGCGSKPYKSIFIHKVQKYIGIDNKSSFADIKNDFLKAKLKAHSFNTILCTQVLEHVPDPEVFLKKIHTVLKRGGYMILTVPFVGSLHEQPTDYYRFTKFSLSYLLKKTDYKIEYIKEEGNWISSISNYVCFYLEGTFNKYYLRFPKKVILATIQITLFMLSHLPDRLTKPELCPMNYIAIAQKVS